MSRRGWAAAAGLVFAGGCVGGVARYALIAAWPAAAGRFPWSTFLANLVGAALLGLVLARTGRSRHEGAWRLLLGTGLCGALTTFAGVVVAADQLLGHGQVGLALGYLAATALATPAAVWAGMVAAR